MKRRLLYLAGAAAGLALLVVGFRVARTLAFFQVRRVELVGGRYLTPTAVARELRVPARTSIFDPTDSLTARARRMPGVLEARISRRLPGTLRVTIREADAVALSDRNGRLVLVDTAGRVLPFDPTRPAADLPLADADVAVARVLARIRDTDAALFARIERGSRAKQDVVVELGAGRVLFRTDATREEIRDLSLVEDLLSKSGRSWRELDARFSSRVVVRGRGA